MKIAIAGDHTSYDLKSALAAYITDNGHQVINLGANAGEACDYPTKGLEVARFVVSGGADLGVAICGTGVGISMAAGKVQGARVACVSEPLSAMYARLHNGANIVAIGSRIISPDTARRIVGAFIDTGYSGEERHIRRMSKVTAIENGTDID